MINKLAKEFITPIERGDIIDLVHYIDNVTDNIKDILVKIYMFNISEIKKEGLGFTDVIIRNCNELKKLMKEFHNFKKSSEINKLIININDLEEEGDRLYINSIKNLYTSSKDPIEIMTWTGTFKYFERCCDSCESVVMKNS